MAIRYNILICFLLASITSCESIDYQKIIINAKNKELHCTSNEYIIDSISLELNDNVVYSVSLLNKDTGESKVILDKLNSKYKSYLLSDFTSCDEFVGQVFIRKKGNLNPITKEVINQKTDYKEIQQFFISFNPCLDSLKEFEALRKFK
ncbi:hypothetical protein [Flavobacterium cucumis]|nr:hypothetical protein [Flavobacterium cucumis]